MIALDGETLADALFELLGLLLTDIATVELVDASLLDVNEGEPDNEGSAVAEIVLIPDTDGLMEPSPDKLELPLAE